MKIIRPIEILSKKPEVSAVTENYVSWLQGGQGVLGALAARNIPSDAMSTTADSSKTVFQVGPGNDYRLYLYDSATDEVEDITGRLSGFASILYGFEISRDGAFIVATARVSEAGADYVIAVNTTTWQVYQFQANHRRFAVMADSSGFVFPESRAGGSIIYSLISFSTMTAQWSKTVGLSGIDYDDPFIYCSSDSLRLIIQDSVYFSYYSSDNYFGLISYDIATDAAIYKKLADAPSGRSNASGFRVSPTTDAVAISYWSPVDGNTRRALWRASDLSELWAAQDVGGYPEDERAIGWAWDGSEFTVGSSLYPRIHRVAAAGGGLLTVPAFDTEGGAAYVGGYVESYIVINAAGIDSPFFIDTATGTLASYVQPSFKKGDRVIFRDSVFEALTDNNDRPDLGATLEVPTWLNLGAANPLRMFDGKLDTLTTAPSPLTVSITPGELANGIALFNVTAQTVQITMTDPVEGRVYDSGEIQMLDNASIRDWYGFFFEPYLRKADAARINLPPYPDATIAVTLSAPGEEVSAGQLVLGTIQRFGETVYGTSVGITDFSRKESDTFGNYQIVERRFSKRAEYDVSIDTRAVASVQRTLAAYRAKPVVWVGAVEQEETIVYGYYRDFDIVIDNYSTSDATITVEGL